MADGYGPAMAALNGAMFHGRALTVNEAQKLSAEPRQDRFSEIMDRFEAHYGGPESQNCRSVVSDLKELAEAGHVDAAQQLADILSLPGPYYDPEAAYKWYYIALSQ